MQKGDPITLAEVSAVLGVKKTSELIPLCHPLPIDHTATKIILNEKDYSLSFCSICYSRDYCGDGSNYGSKYCINNDL